MIKIRRIGISSFGALSGILYALFGLCVGILMTGISLLGIIFSGSSQSAQSSYSTISGSSSIGGVLTGLGAVVCLPVVYGVLGFITGIITAFFLNLALKYAGGLEIEADGFQLPAPLKDIPPKIEPLGPLPR